ncbi:MAG TPA: ATP-dependent helicase [Intrasporangiaceae bacterium]|nr:ATP-dependent helicase [Intrasporangiaceae bacterium]
MTGTPTEGDAVLERFSAATAEWFRSSFAAPTPAQVGAWQATSSGRHALVVAPTGSGKTLSAFLWALDRLTVAGPPPDPMRRCRVLYVSPLKALAVDVERNLRSPLVGIGHAARRLGLPEIPDITVAVRSGDTPASERRAFAKQPADILITTPESLFLLLTSQARESLRGVDTVIIDEIHAVAGTKRGAHLALSLERLDALLDRPAQRVGLSATVCPVEEVARFLAGGREVDIVAPPADKEWDLQVVIPVPDLSELGQVVEDDLSGPAAGDPRRTSIWPHVEERVCDLIEAHRSTIVFTNSRRLAERLTTRLNEIWLERHPEQEGVGVLARAHHGSMSKEHRAQIEDDLKAGRLPAVVATSSLELGIDMGAVDLVIQVESPPSVASGLQRVGRAGHQVGAVSRGVLFPKFRADLLSSAVVVERMRAGAIEPLRIPANPLDVLAQQVVAMAAMDDWAVADLETLVRRAAPFATLSRPVLDATLDMLAGRYPSEEFAELRARIVWDRLTDTITGRRGAQRLAVTSGGTIPDRGLYGVFLAGGDGPGRRVGELDEEMVYESRVGDVFTLGTSTWRIEDITHDQVLVSPASGIPARLPFWKGDSLGRPYELGQALGQYVRETLRSAEPFARERISASGLDEWAVDNLLGYLREQRDATGSVPDDRTLVVERFRDEIGDWRVVVHSPYGRSVHAPWALAVAARMRERFGVDVNAMAADDGIVLRLPDVEFDAFGGVSGGASGERDGDAARDGIAGLVEAILIDPDEVAGIVTEEIGGSPLFASRFRECAARALLLPRRRPDRRQPLWQQRQRAAHLLEVASAYPTFPIILETVRECVQDVFDVPALVDLLRRMQRREVQVVDVQTPQPSPFAQSMLFGYIAAFLYEGDSPLAERRAAALALDPALLADLLGQSEGLSLRDLLDPESITRTEAELQRRTPQRACRDGEDVVDLLRSLGPLTAAAVVERTREEARPSVPAWLDRLVEDRQVIAVRIGGEDRFAAIEDAARLRDALGVSLPVGVSDAYLQPVPDPIGDLVRRYARTHGPFHVAEVAAWLGLGVAVVADTLARLAASGRVTSGEFLPAELLTDLPEGQRGSPEWCDPEVLRLIRRRSLAALRAEVEPVEPRAYATFLPTWHAIPGGLWGRAGLLRAVEQLSGAVLPASALESVVLPARVADYSPALLDDVMSSGEVLWQGHGSLAGDDGWVSLHLAETAHLTLHAPSESGAGDGTPGAALLEVLSGGGAMFFGVLADQARASADAQWSDAEIADVLWDLVWSGAVTGDTLAPLRARLGGGRTTHRRAGRRTPTRARHAGRSGLGLLGSARLAGSHPLRSTPPGVAGRWSRLPEPVDNVTARTLARAEVLLDRYGIVTRGVAEAEDVPGGFAGLYRVYAQAEETGVLRRGYFIEHLGAAQFGATATVDRLRATSVPPDPGPGRGGSAVLVLAATDPAQPFGAALPWPPRPRPGDGSAGQKAEGTAAGKREPDGRRGHQPGRKAGALVVLRDGELLLYVERGGRTVLTWTEDPDALRAAAAGLAAAVRAGALGRLTVTRADGADLLGSGSPLVEALLDAGFHMTPRGLRIRA